MRTPFTGIGVLEVGEDPAVGYAGKLFADLGAEVTSVTRAPRPDIEENAAPREADPLALYLGQAKRRVFCDVPESMRNSLTGLLPRSRVLLCGGIEKVVEIEKDIRPAVIAEEFPALVVAAITPFGLAAGTATPADDLTLQALGGISLGIGLPEKPPLKLPGNQTAFQAGLCAAVAAAGLVCSGRGGLLDVSAADVWASFYTGVEVALAHFGRHRKQRAGQRAIGQPYPRTLFRCRDGYFAIQCGESRHWQSFLHMLGRDDLLSHPLFANRFTANDRHGDECDALIEPWFKQRTKEEVLALCLEHRIPGAPAYDMREVVQHAHLRHRGHFVQARTRRGAMLLPGAPYVGLKEERSTADATAGPGRIESGSTASCEAAAISAGSKPLEGIRVVDFGWVWAGAVPGHILADMGAEVIKVESASPLDYMRQGRPIVGTQKDPEQNPMFQNVNRGKLSLRLKLDHPDAQRVVKDLVARSDVVIENFSPGVMAKFGLAYPDLRAARSDIVMCSMSAAGQTGPLRGIRTYATMIASLAGLDSLVGYEDGRVLGSQSSYADPNASLHATFGILAALTRRRRSGLGAYIDLSQWEAAVCVMGEAIARYGLEHTVPAPGGAAHATKAPHGNYPAAGSDAWIAISVSTDAQWKGLANALGDPPWTSDPNFGTAAERRANRAELDRRLGSETAQHEAEALAAILTAAGVPAAPLLDASGVAASARFRERRLFETVHHPVLGSLPVYRLPWWMDGAPVPVSSRAPLLGEHNDHVLRDVLHYPVDRIVALRENGLFS